MERSCKGIIFLSTLSLRRATPPNDRISEAEYYFYPRSPCGERHILIMERRDHSRFLSTLSLRRATRKRHSTRYMSSHFYPRSPCGERLLPGRLGFLSFPFLSTLSLRRATVLRKVPILGIKYFYPRSPCGERPKEITNTPQKTPHFYPRSPCGERLFGGQLVCHGQNISIHALLAESDGLFIVAASCFFEFLSTLSLRRATSRVNAWWAWANLFLSTLSLRRATLDAYIAQFDVQDFYPRSPCGERL